jgi:hypothetical protein
MSKALADLVELNQDTSAVNNSKGKALYSFNKAQRFGNFKKPPSESIGYDLPNTKTMRSTSFGFGKKSDFSKTNHCKWVIGCLSF